MNKSQNTSTQTITSLIHYSYIPPNSRVALLTDHYNYINQFKTNLKLLVGDLT